MRDWVNQDFEINKFPIDKISFIWEFSVLLENIILMEKMLIDWILKEGILNEDKLLEEEKQSLLKELAKNYPWFEVFDNLNIGDNFFMTIFTGVKFLNTKYSQNFVDNILNKFKNELNREFKKRDKNIKIIWDDYKNFLIKSDLKEEELSQIIKSLEYKLYESYKEEVLHIKDESIEEIEKENFPMTFFIWKWKIKKIDKFSKEENIQLSIGQVRLDLEKKSKKLPSWLLDAEEFKKNIEIENMSYTENNCEYTIEGNYLKIKEQKWRPIMIKIIDENWFFTKEIITIVRKNKIPENLELYQKVKKSSDLLISNFEFIFPLWNCVGNIERYKKVKNLIKNWKDWKELEVIDKYLDTYYKWFLSPSRFNKIIYNKKWQMYFIDIKEMWMINIIWFFEEYVKVQKGEITYEQSILNSGSKMTKIFENFLKNIRNQLEWKKIYINVWWDEIKLFIEDNYEHEKIVGIINNSLSEKDVSCRITTRKKNEEECIITISEELDKKTNKSKKIEHFLQIIENRDKIKKYITEVIYIYSDENWEYNLKFWEYNFLLKEVIGPNWEIIENSQFFKFVDEKWLGRKTER